MDLQTPLYSPSPALPGPLLARLERQARALALLSRGDFVRTLRQSHNLRQEDLAKMAGCTRAMISHLEMGRATASAELAERIATALGVLAPLETCMECAHD